MKKVMGLLCLIFLVCILTFPIYGDYIKVSRSANIYADPDKNTTVLERASDGDKLSLIYEGTQINGYYPVITSTGRSGWIYRTLVRRYRGIIPKKAPEFKPANPLADTTLHLTSEQKSHAVQHLRLGKPQAVYERAREGYVLAQDARLKIPVWVQYELNSEDIRGPADRSDDFRPDTSIPYGARAELSDYRGSGFDRGHMAPAADMKRSQKVMSESFLLSNMAPQVGIGFNRHIWAELEAAVRGWVEQRGQLTIIIGPVFAVQENQVKYGVIGDNHVAVPSHFYKIIADTSNPEKVEALAFMLPNETLPGRHYSEFLISIDEIEKATGLDFLSALSSDVQESVESQKAAQVW